MKTLKFFALIGLSSIFIGLAFVAGGADSVGVARAFIGLYGFIITIMTIVSIRAHAADL